VKAKGNSELSRFLLIRRTANSGLLNDEGQQKGRKNPILRLWDWVAQQGIERMVTIVIVTGRSAVSV
jgi:hypothetical protein